VLPNVNLSENAEDGRIAGKQWPGHFASEEFCKPSSYRFLTTDAARAVRFPVAADFLVENLALPMK
jgi:hypothetical protein